MISPRHDQQRAAGGWRHHSVDEVLRCRRSASRNDVVMVPPVGRALAAEHAFDPRLGIGRLSDTLSALARKYEISGAQLAIHHGGETVAIEVGELESGTGNRITRDAAFPIGSISKTFIAHGGLP